MTTLSPTALKTPNAPLRAEGDQATGHHAARDRALISLLVIWLLTQFWFSTTLLPLSIQGFLVKLKSPVGLLCLLGMLVLGRQHVRVHRPFRLLILFGSLMVLMSVLRSVPDLKSAVLYGVWTLSFLILPHILGTRQRLRLFVRSSVVVLTVSLILAVIASVLLDDYKIENIRDRHHFGLGNPNYTAQFFVGVYLLAAINNYLFKQRLTPGSLLLMCLALIGCILTDSRSALLFLGLFSFLVMYSSRGSARYGAIILVPLLLLGLVFQANTFARQAGDLGDIDAIASNRLSVWSASVELNFWDANMLEILTGPDVVRNPTGLSRTLDRLSLHNQTVSGAKVESNLQRANIDNNYLDVLLLSGILGLGLCITAWWSWYRLLSPDAAATEIRRRHRVIARSVIIGMLGVGFVGPVFPVFGAPWLTVMTAIAIGNTQLGFKPRQESFEPNEGDDHAEETKLAAARIPRRNKQRRWNPPGRIS